MANSASLKREASALRAVNFSFAYPDNTSALRGIDLEVPAGEAVAIIGPNGAGKSTLLLCLAGLLQGSGEIYVHGDLLLPATARQLRRQIALVFQNPDDQLFMPVLEEDVAFGPLNLGLSESEVEARVQAALQQVQLLDKKQRPPHHLSYGEKRRAALATALAMQPKILLLDEPTSNLDPAARHELISYLANWTGTRVVSTHDLGLARSLCTRCALLSAGKLIAIGATEQVLSDFDLLRAHRLLAP